MSPLWPSGSQKSKEKYTREDWIRLQQRSASQRFERPKFGRGRPRAMWIFDRPKQHVFGIYANPVARPKAGRNRFEDYRKRLQAFAQLVPCLVSHSDSGSVVGSINNLVEMELLPRNIGEEIRGLIVPTDKLVKRQNENFEIYILRPEDNFTNVGFTDAEHQIINGFVNDRSTHVWAPNFLYNTASDNIPGVIAVFSDPQAFTPDVKYNSNFFLWPWQRCIVQGDSDSATPSIRYENIETVSMVFDVRNSTAAMSFSTDPGKFAEFISRVVSSARKEVRRHGGFFDKETGDGIVAHFCPTLLENWQSISGHPVPNDNAEKLAFDAGMAILQEVSRICDDYHPYLTHTIQNLAAGIGIHSGHAVWISDDQGVSAIGDSVVTAARLCSAAKARSLLISNRTRIALTGDGSSYNYQGHDLESQVVALKGIDQGAEIVAYRAAIARGRAG